MPRDAASTRARILDAAMDEFAAAGHAGARVERIARSAQTNVRMIYAYFGGKAPLFDAAYRAVVAEMSDALPPRADDLAGWAGEVFDFYQRSPRTQRLTTWALLERPETAREPLAEYAAKVHSLSEVVTSDLTATDLLVFLYAIAGAWQTSPEGLIALGDEAGRDATARRRAAVVSAAARLLAD